MKVGRNVSGVNERNTLAYEKIPSLGVSVTTNPLASCLSECIGVSLTEQKSDTSPKLHSVHLGPKISRVELALLSAWV